MEYTRPHRPETLDVQAVGPFRKSAAHRARVGANALMHGGVDTVMPVRGAVDALAQLQGLRAVATLDCFAGLGHGIDGRVVDAMVRRLNEPVPMAV